MRQPDDPEGWLMILVVAVLAAALLIGVKQVFAQERDECYWLWDMALVARALAEEKMPQSQIVSALGRIYNGPAEARVMMTQMAIASALPAPLFASVIRSRCNALTPRSSTPPLAL